MKASLACDWFNLPQVAANKETEFSKLLMHDSSLEKSLSNVR